MAHPTLAELQAALDHILASPAAEGWLELIVARPRAGERSVLEVGILDPTEGLVGDNWQQRGSTATADGAAHPLMQLNLMNARVSALVARLGQPGPDRRPLAGDQLHVDLDLSVANLPAGTRLAVGSAVIEVTGIPHRGCAKFVQRFGADAMRFVNSPEGVRHNLRGINARVLSGGAVRRGDALVKLAGGAPQHGGAPDSSG